MSDLKRQREGFKERFYVEALREKKENLEAIKTFTGTEHGEWLAGYLREDAWADDEAGVTRVYLVRDASTNEIAAYFGLKAGLLYSLKLPEYRGLTKAEKELLDICEDALQNDAEDSIPYIMEYFEREQDVDLERVKKAYQGLKYHLDRIAKDPDPTSAQYVAATSPGIVLTHWCRNEAYEDTRQQDNISLGFGIFWEIIVELVLQISKLLGAQYLYLFAADNTPAEPEPFDSNFCESDEESQPVYKLVDYYMHALRFEPLHDLYVLKPAYDFKCHSMIQPISALRQNRIEAWQALIQSAEKTKTYGEEK
ncbi:MAG: hypothetical protein HDQ87_06235 [Clostridia bacterium]|nr:hypothetical protein [Clostridia bacterium]